MKHYKIYHYFTFLIFNFTIIAAPLTNLPITIKQPDGKIIHCFASGDEFHNWIHDKDNYTIIQDQKTGYWTYAVKVNNVISASNYIVGQDDPKSLNLLKGINLSPEEILQKRNNILKSRLGKSQNSLQSIEPEKSFAQSKGIVNNLAIFVRFADDPEFIEDISYYEKLFNTGEGSVRNYFLEDSYGKLTLNTHFFPKSDNKILSYRDINPRNYYIRYNEITNPIGYMDRYELETRENDLVKRAVNILKVQVPSNLNIDTDNNGQIDNLCLIIVGVATGYNEFLWPHFSRIIDTVTVNGINVDAYTLVMNIQNYSPEYLFNISCHELGHSIGFPDLYRYNNPGEPVGRWDMMSRNVGHSGAWMKYKYMRWIDSIPEIQQEGKYTLNDITKPSNNCYKIRSAVSSEEFLVVEYRKKEGLFEKDIPGSGLLVTRINPSAKGNGGGPPDEIYYYRPDKDGFTYGDIMNAFFSSDNHRTKLNLTTNPPLIFSEKSNPEVEIFDIGSSQEQTISFSVKRKNRISAILSKRQDTWIGGNFNINVNYLFPNQNSKWSASIIYGHTWMRLSSDSTGTNVGQANITYDENNSDVLRSGIVRIFDLESLASPIDLEFIQVSKICQLEKEPNDIFDQAMQIVPGILFCGMIEPSKESDYYKFSAIEGDTVEIQYTDRQSTSLGHLNFYKTGYSWIQSTKKIEGNITRYFIVIPKTDTYYAIVTPYSSSGVFGYTISILDPKHIEFEPKISYFSVSGRDVTSVLSQIHISTYGLPTDLKIEYGPTKNYGKTYLFSYSLQGTLLSNYFTYLYEKITGLQPNTKYHFRLVAKNNKGVVYSKDCEATTNSTLYFIPEAEPNQTKEQATQLYFGDSVCGSISSSSDIDYFKFYANAGDMVTIRLDENSNANKGSLYFLLNQQFPYSGNVNNGIILIKNTIQTSGIYYIYVQNKSGNNSPFNYSLVLDKFQYSAPKYISINFYGNENIVETNYNSIRIYPTISTSGLPTTIKIEYGTTRNYGKIYSHTGLIPDPNFSNDFLIYVPMVVSGLEPNTTYHLRVIVENDLGKDVSKDYTITTLPKPFGFKLLPYNDSLISLNCLALVDQNTLIASSNAYPTNSIFRSSDQGKSWKRCDNNIYSANSISTFDGINIMIGSYQYIYKSTDGGNNWSIVINKSSTSFSSIFNIDQKITYAAGYSYSTSPNTYFITKTIDGGVTWNTLISSTIIQLNKILFINENNGFALGNKGLLIKTKDGGQNWIEQKTDTTYNFKNIYFTDNNKGFIVGDFYRITSYTDSTGKVFNTYNYSSLILKTTDGGNTWERQNITTKKTLSCIIFNDKNNGIIVGYEGIILKTTNGGNSWIEQPSGTTAHFIGTCFLDPSTVMIVGSNGTIIKGNFNSEPIYEPTDFKLSNNYPNPFNSQTNIEYSIPEDGLVKIKIYDILGREVETILNENQKSGKYGISWKPQNISTGIYYYRIEADKYKETKKLLYLK